jgi:transposase InsO family protein
MPQAYGDRHDEAGATPLPSVLLLRRPLTPPRPGRLIWCGGQFIASRPNQLWVCDLTYLRTWIGFTYLALVIAVHSRCMVGWALTTHLRTDLPLEALKMQSGAAPSVWMG